MQVDRRWVMAGVFVALFLVSLNQTMVTTALPRIVASLGGLAYYGWVFTAYMLGSTVMVPIYGKVSDVIGRRPVLLFGLALFILGALFAGHASTMTGLIAARTLQGLGAGAVMPVAFALVADLYPPHERGSSQGLVGAVFGVSSLIGPLAGGWITDVWGWHWAFWANIPLGILALGAVASTVPARAHEGARPAIDIQGAIFLVLGLVPFLLWSSLGGHQFGWLSLPSGGLLAMALAFGAAFIWQEKRAPDPIIALDLFANASFTVSLAISFLGGMAMFGTMMCLPLFAQGVLSLSATASGAIITPMVLALVFSSTVSGRLATDTTRYRPLCVAGSALMAAGGGLLATMGPAPSPYVLAGAVIVLGLGLGTTMPIVTLAAQGAVPPSRLGSVTALVMFGRTIGGTLGVAILGALMTLSVHRTLQARFPELPVDKLPDPQLLLGGATGLHPELLATLRMALATALHDVFLATTVIGLAAVAVSVLLRMPAAQATSAAEQATSA